MTTCFFFRRCPPEELPHQTCSPRRGEVDSSIPRVFGSFWVIVFEALENAAWTNWNLSRQKNEGREPPYSPRVRRPTSSRRGLLSGSCTSSIRGTWKKNRWSCEIIAWKNVTNTEIDSHATLSQNIGKFTSKTNQELTNISKFTSDLLSIY